MDKDVFELDRMLENEPLAQPVFRHQRHAFGDRVAGACDLDWLPSDEDVARALAVDAKQDTRQRAAAAAEQPRDADDFARVEREIDRNGLARTGQGTDFEERRAARGAAALDVGEAARATADDVLDDLVERQFGHRGGDDVPSVAQDGGAIGDPRDLVHAVRDVDDRHALGLEPAEKGEQLLDLAAGKRGRRLVENEHAYVARDRLDDLGELALPGREIPDEGLRIDLDAERLEQFAGAPGGGFVVDQAKAVLGLVVQEDVLRRRQRRHETHLLEDHADPRALGGFRRVHFERLAVDLDAACGRRMNAVQDLEDRRLAGPILPEQCVDFAHAHVEADVAERRHAAEGLRDAGQADGERSRCGIVGHRVGHGSASPWALSFVGATRRGIAGSPVAESEESIPLYFMLLTILSVAG